MARPQLRLALIAAVLLISALTVPRVFAPREIAVPNNLVGAYVDVSRPSPLNPSPGARVQAAFDQMPLAFIANQGQLDDRVAYYVQGRDTSLYFTPQGVTFGLTGPAAPQAVPNVPADNASLLPVAFRTTPEQPTAHQRYAIKLDFVGANPKVRPIGQDPTTAMVSYFKGPREQWKTGLPTYGSVVYADLWPGIDLIYTGTANRLKYTFVVKPGGDPAQIKLAYRGATAVSLNDAGQLVVSTPAGGFVDDRPYGYQEIDGERVEIASPYTLDSSADIYTYGFRIGSYDSSRPLILDPAVLVYAGYIGGALDEYGYDIAIDSAGNTYITGGTSSANATFPVTVGPDLTYNGGSSDVFVAKVRSDGTGLAYAGYIGGADNDIGTGIAVDRNGNAYVTGETRSDQLSFPATGGPDLSFNGSVDAFVVKIRADGKGIIYAGYLGGADEDAGTDIAVDNAANAYITGATSSDESSFPAIGGPDLTFNGIRDAFVAKVKADGTKLLFAGYIGGGDDDLGTSVKVDNTGNTYVTGGTKSAEATFPAMVGPDLTYNGNVDAFVAKVRADGMALGYAGYIGGTDNDQGMGIAVDNAGNAYITGVTFSTEASFPVIGGPDLTFNGYADAYAVKVKADGTGLVYAGYVGGAIGDQGNDIAVDSVGNAYIVGATFSPETSFPVKGGPDLTYNGGIDAFLAKINADGAALIYAGYMGGAAEDDGIRIALDNDGNAYIVGNTFSAEATFPAQGGPDLTYNGNRDVFVAKITYYAQNYALYLPLIQK